MCQESAYKLAETLCANGLAARLSEQLRDEYALQVRQSLAVLAQFAAASSTAVCGTSVAAKALLPTLVQVWSDHCRAIRRLSLIFAHLDGRLLAATFSAAASATAAPDAPTLSAFGLRLFREGLAGLSAGEVQRLFILGVLDLVDEDRIARLSPRAPSDQSRAALLRELLSLLVDLGLYDTAFEGPWLERTATFYRRESQRALSSSDLAEYLRHCEERLEEERRRCTQVSSEAALLAAVRRELVARHAGDLTGRGFAELVDGPCLESLARLYRLLGAVGELPALRRAWGAKARTMAAAALQLAGGSIAPEASKQVVPTLVVVHAKLRRALAEAFCGDGGLQMALGEALGAALDDGGPTFAAKLLARHVDELLRDERAGGGEAELEACLEGAVGLFRHLGAKDAFEAFYRKDLAKRLLQRRTAAQGGADADTLLMHRLKELCGAAYVAKLEGMMQDIAHSKSLIEDFLLVVPEASAGRRGGRGALDFSAAVLTSGRWPMAPAAAGSEVLYPPLVVRLQDRFRDFYVNRHSGRSLTWSAALGQCTLRGTFEGGVKKELVVSTLQALVLLLFNNSDKLAVVDIGRATGIVAADLSRTLQSLALHKTVKILLKEAKGRDVSDADVFTFNEGFSHKLKRIVVAQIGPKERLEEEAGVERRLREDMLFEMDAVIVRIMKARRSLKLQPLVAETLAALSSPAGADAAAVESRVERLIEREFLERHPSEASTYNYLA